MPLILNDILLKNRRTKIIATLGPSTTTPEVLEQILAAGVNVVRLNMSHGSHESHAKNYASIRNLAKKMGLPVAVLVDLSGPKMRCGKFVDGKITLKEHETVIVTVDDVIGKPGLIPSQYTALTKDVRVGNSILLDDGALELRVESITGNEITAKVIHGGILKDHKGINLPNVAISTPVLTQKDKKDAIFAQKLGADYIALSFVSKASDILELRALTTAAIIAKIEKPEALSNIDEIIDASDGIMIARGDLGVEMAAEDVPTVQDQLIDLTVKKMKPVIVATQMLESMIVNPRPTRAEVTDVSYAVNSGADAVMLSAETASGEHPVKSVEIMDRIARRAEARLWKEGMWGTSSEDETNFSKVIANATAKMSKELLTHACMVVCTTCLPALIIASARPASPIVAIVSNESDYQRLALVWGVIPIMQKDIEGVDLITFAKETAIKQNLARVGDCILLVNGFTGTVSPSITIIKV